MNIHSYGITVNVYGSSLSYLYVKNYTNYPFKKSDRVRTQIVRLNACTNICTGAKICISSVTTLDLSVRDEIFVDVIQRLIFMCLQSLLSLSMHNALSALAKRPCVQRLARGLLTCWFNWRIVPFLSFSLGLFIPSTCFALRRDRSRRNRKRTTPGSKSFARRMLEMRT